MPKLLLTLLMAMMIAPSMIAQRIITVGGICTETVAALGLEKSIVAVDVTSLYPERVRSLPNLGFFRTLNVEAMLAHKPTHVVMTDEAGPAGIADRLRSAGVTVITVATVDDPDAGERAITAIATAFGKKDAAASIIAERKRRTKAVAEKASASAAHPRVLFIYVRGPKVTVTSGRGTAIDKLITLCGGVNAATHEGSKALTAEAVLAAKPDVIVVTTHGAESIGGVAKVRDLPGVSATPAATKNRIVALDDSLLLTMGPRLGEAAEALSAAILGPTAGKKGR